MGSFNNSNKESKNTMYFWFVFLYVYIQILNYLIKQKDIDSGNHSIYKNFYNKQAKEIK